jgi:hypothetical protein
MDKVFKVGGGMGGRCMRCMRYGRKGGQCVMYEVWADRWAEGEGKGGCKGWIRL